MAKINIERYTQEDASFGATATTTASAFGRMSMAESKIEGELATIEQSINDSDKMFTDAERLQSEVDYMEAKLQADTITADEAMALMRAADSITHDYAGLNGASYTQEGATLDPRAELMASKDDKRGYMRKIIDAAKKANAKMISGFRKIILKLSNLFDSTYESAKSLKEDLEKLKTGEFTEVAFDANDSETIKDRHLAACILAKTYDTNDVTVTAIFESVETNKNMNLADIINTDAKDDVDENPTPASDDDLINNECQATSVGKTSVRVLYQYKEDDVQLPYFKSFSLSTDKKAGTVKTASVGDLKTICASIASTMKDYSKTVQKSWKQVEAEEKAFDKVAKAMKSDPSDSAKKEYKAALAKYKATPKVAFYEAVDAAANAKAFLLTCQEAYDKGKKKPEEEEEPEGGNDS